MMRSFTCEGGFRPCFCALSHRSRRLIPSERGNKSEPSDYPSKEKYLKGKQPDIHEIRHELKVKEIHVCNALCNCILCMYAHTCIICIHTHTHTHWAYHHRVKLVKVWWQNDKRILSKPVFELKTTHDPKVSKTVNHPATPYTYHTVWLVMPSLHTNARSIFQSQIKVPEQLLICFAAGWFWLYFCSRSGLNCNISYKI